MAAPPSPRTLPIGVIIATRQQITRDWWQNEASGYEVFISQVVLEECSEGEPSAAAERLEVVKDQDLLESSDEVDDLADALISGKASKTAAGGLKHDEPIDAPDRNGLSGFNVKSASFPPVPAGGRCRSPSITT
jgi:hypothetical protein